MISVPESIAFYWADPTNRAAVDVLADQFASRPARSEVPPDLSLNEAEHFELALLAAQRIRVDLWRLLRSIWAGTWENAVRTEFPSGRLLTYGGHADCSNGEWTPSVHRAWDEGRTYGIHDVPGRGRLVTFVRLTRNDQDLEVGFGFADQQEDWSIGEQLDLGPEWTTDDDGWRVATSEDIRMAGSTPEIDLSSLAALSRSTLAALKAAII